MCAAPARISTTTPRAPIRSTTLISQPIPNAAQSLFVGSDNVARANVLPAVGFDWRYPFFAKTPFGSLTVEPIAQLITRPDRGIGSTSLVNIDAQSLVFDDSTLFAWNKFSGYDRFETGTRFNYGGQFTLNFQNGGFLNAMGGQSLQVAGRNSFATADAANVGISSGLDTRRSDYVGRLAIAPNSVFSFVAKGRFDTNTFSPRRIDLIGSATFGALVVTTQYANYASQPYIGFDVRREGVSFGAKYDVTSNYYVSSNVTFDLSRHLYNNTLAQPAIFLNPVTGQSFSVATNRHRRHRARAVGRRPQHRRGLSRRVHDVHRQLFIDLSAQFARPAVTQSDDPVLASAAHARAGQFRSEPRPDRAERRHLATPVTNAARPDPGRSIRHRPRDRHRGLGAAHPSIPPFRPSSCSATPIILPASRVHWGTPCRSS